MPYTLPPISRRRFVGGSLATLAGSLLGRRDSLATTTDPTSWILLSDSHIAADRELVSRGTSMGANLADCVRQAVAAHGKAAGVLLSGDCAYLDGKPEDYATLGELLRPMREAGLPVHLLLGNHDHRANFSAALGGADAPPPLDHRVVAVIESPLANWFLLDSLDQTNKTPGMLGPDQRAWLEKSLDARPDKPALVVVHHNVTPFAPDSAATAFAESVRPQGGKGGLMDSEDLLAILGPRRQVKACLFGHTHVWSVMREAGGIHLINLPPTAYVFKPAMPSGWIHAALRHDGMALTLNCLDPSHTAHRAIADLTWRV